MNYLFFSCSKSTIKEFTELFDFVWPTAAAMWNLRWQVAGYYAARPDATVEELSGRFLYGTGINGVNYKKSYIDQSWEDQTHHFSKLLLTNAFSLYEYWIVEILGALDMNYKYYSKKLQYSSKYSRTGIPTQGIQKFLTQACQVSSPALKNSFYSSLCTHRKYSSNELDSLMLCYRYFKELRNCIMHNGGIATKAAFDAYNDFKVVANNTALKTKEVPIHHPVVEGSPVKLDLRGVVGFTDIIIRIICTCDIELSTSAKAEKEFLKNWKTTHRMGLTISKRNEFEESKRINRCLRALSLPDVSSTADLKPFLTRNRLIN